MDKLLELLGNAGVMAAIIALVEYLIKRHDAKKGKMAEIDSKVGTAWTNGWRRQRKSELRTQLLLMVSDYPDDKAGIMAVAQHYFEDLKGNWYATSIFNQWLKLTRVCKTGMV